MKKSVALLSALVLVSGSAFASKARMAALSNAAYLTDDTQSIFDNVARITQIGDFATYELGTSTTRSLGANALDSDFNPISQAPGLYPEASGNGTRIYAADAEGGFVLSHGDSKYGFYMGRKSPFTTLARAIGGFLGQENTVEVMYANKSAPIGWGVSANYSSANDKGTTVAQKENAMGVRLGLVGSSWDAYAVVGLSSSADGASKTAYAPQGFTAISDSTATYRGTAGYKFGGGYWLNNWYINGAYYQDGAKVEYATAPTGTYATNGYLLQKNNIEQTHWEVGAINAMKTDGSTFFWGFYYASDAAKNKENQNAAADAYKLTKTSLPVLMGFEVDAMTGLKVRASVKQNFVLGDKKAQDKDANSIDNNTTAAAGIGIVWNKVNLDATISKNLTPSAGTTGDINQDNLMSNASLTYWF